jgi:uncharacterized protein YbdZ (MbtH family)
MSAALRENYEEPYSIWLGSRENALGWKNEGKVGLKTEA